MKKTLLAAALVGLVATAHASDFGVGLISGLIVGAVAVDAHARQHHYDHQRWEHERYRQPVYRVHQLPPPQIVQGQRTCTLQPLFDGWGNFITYHQECR